MIDHTAGYVRTTQAGGLVHAPPISYSSKSKQRSITVHTSSLLLKSEKLQNNDILGLVDIRSWGNVGGTTITNAAWLASRRVVACIHTYRLLSASSLLPK